MYSLAAMYLAQERYFDAIDMAQALKKKNLVGNQLMDINSVLVESYNGINKTDLSVSLLRENIRIKDSLHELSTKTSIAEIETKYQVAEKENQIQAAELALTKKEAQQQIILVFTFGLLVLLAGFIAFYRSLQKKNKEMATLINTIETQNAELLEVNEKLSQLNYSISHDALGFVNNILNFSSLAKSELTFTQQSTNMPLFVGNIHLLSEKLRGLIINLLTFAKLENIEDIPKTDTNLNQIIQEIKQFSLIGVDEKDIAIEADNLPVVQANYDLIFQLMQNCINNAIKYSKTDQKLHLKIDCTQNQDYYTIAIQDNGIGISEDKLERIFKPFFREGKKQVKGSGLGLNICKRIIEMHKGTMNVHSTVGEGSTFYFSLPRSHRANFNVAKRADYIPAFENLPQ